MGFDLTEAYQDPPPWFKSHVLKLLESTPWRRYPARVQDELTQAIAYSFGVEKENVIIVRGCTEGLRLSFELAKRQGFSLNIPTPSYFGFGVIAANLGVNYSKYEAGDVGLARTGGNESWTVICSPENPLSHVYGREKIINAAHSSAGVILDLTYDPFSDHPHSARIEDYLEPNIISCLSLSKAYGLAGTRLGLVFAEERIIRKLSSLLDTFSLDHFQLALLSCLFSDSGSLWRSESAKNTVYLRRQAEEILKSIIPGEDIPKSHTNFISVPMGSISRGLSNELVKRTASKHHPDIDLLRITANTETIEGLIYLQQHINHNGKHDI